MARPHLFLQRHFRRSPGLVAAIAAAVAAVVVLTAVFVLDPPARAGLQKTPGAMARDYGHLSDVAFADTNGNGRRDTGEPGIAGVRVAAINRGVEAGIALSGADGTWTIGVPPATYTIEVQLPAGYTYSPVTQGGSQVDPSSGLTPPVPVNTAQTTGGVPIGAIPSPGAMTFTGALSPEGSVSPEFPVPNQGALVVTALGDGKATSSLTVTAPDGADSKATGTDAKGATVSVDGALGGLWKAQFSQRDGTRYVVTVTATGTPAKTGIPSYSRTIGFSSRADIYPSGLDVDAAGVVYVADTGNDAVEAYAPSGSRIWQVGGFGRGEDQLAEPRDVAVLAGKVYVADTGNNRIKVLDAATGRQLAVWDTNYRSIMGISAGVDGAGKPVIVGTEAYPGASAIHIHDPATGALIRTINTPTGTGDGQVEEPRDAATGADGTIYVADFRNHRIAIFSPEGKWIKAVGGLGADAGQFNGPYGIDVDDQGHIYVTDSNNSTIKEFTADFVFVRSMGRSGTGPGEFFQLRRAVVGSGKDPLVYGADLWGNKIEVFDHTSALTQTIGNTHAKEGGFNKPYGLALTQSDLLVADTANQRIQRFRFDGTFESAFGQRGFGEDLAGLNWERDVAVSPTGMIWVADSKNNRLLEFTADGKTTGTALGTLGAKDGQFNWPYAIAFTGSDLIVADTFNNRVQRVTTRGTVLWTVKGLAKPRDIAVFGTKVYLADSDNHQIVVVDAGTGERLSEFGSEQLHSPDGLVVAADGTVFAADTSWHRIVQFTPAGKLVRTFGKRGAGTDQFDRPSKMELRMLGSKVELYIADTANDRIQVYNIA